MSKSLQKSKLPGIKDMTISLVQLNSRDFLSESNYKYLVAVMHSTTTLKTKSALVLQLGIGNLSVLNDGFRSLYMTLR